MVVSILLGDSDVLFYVGSCVFLLGFEMVLV